jgi:SAM-dependent methyltransferase
MSYSKSPWFYNKNFIRRDLDIIHGDVVDVGCGTLKYKAMILGLPKVKKYFGIDFFQANGVDLVADLNMPLALPDCTFDTAVCISVIEHVTEPQVALNEMYRILKPGGHLLLATPWEYPFHHEPNDYFRYSRYALEHMLKKAGFEVVSVHSTGGRVRVTSIYIQRWFPMTTRLLKFLDRFLSEKKARQGAVILDAPDHQVVALRR